MRILNIDQENFDLDEVAYFDVFPSGDFMTFSGSWSNYPYFDSGQYTDLEIKLNVVYNHHL